MPLVDQLKAMSILEVTEQYPQANAVLSKFGLSLYAKTETARHENIQASALVNAINPDLLLDALVEAIEH